MLAGKELGRLNSGRIVVETKTLNNEKNGNRYAIVGIHVLVSHKTRFENISLM